MTADYPTIQHRWFEEVWNQGRLETVTELLDPDVLGHGLVDETGKNIRGVESFLSFFKMFKQAFPDIHITIEESVTEGDKIMVLCRVRGTHADHGIGFGPTGKAVDFTGMCMVRVRNGKIVESWNSFDFLGMFQQLGLVEFSKQ